MTLYAGIEAGGTKFICAVGSAPERILAQTTFPTTDPSESIQKALDFFSQVQGDHGSVAAIGVASFGPLDPDPASDRFGTITTTPKPGWADFDFVGALRRQFNQPVAFDTDVNGAALGEWRWGAAQGLDTFIYMTIGTGIGGGGMVNGKLIHGLLHPEMGHMRIPHDLERDPFPGNCPYHQDCLEGLANGPAIEKRWGARGETLPSDHPAWELEAEYLALAVVNLIVTLSPQRIILGGGVMQQKQLFPLIRDRVSTLLNHYVQCPEILEDIDRYILPPGLGKQAGVLGAIALAIEAERTAS